MLMRDEILNETALKLCVSFYVGANLRLIELEFERETERFGD